MTTITHATRETCRVCWRPNPIGFQVPDDVWAEAVHPALARQWGANLVLCIGCFAAMADERLIAWERDIELYPVSAASMAAPPNPREEGSVTSTDPAPAGREENP